jgi:UDP-N-acetylglucosamine 2-epimerase (non-hydrolysing)
MTCKILLIFGTRPEAIKLFPVVAALKSDPAFDVKVCVSAQHRGMLDQVLSIAGITPDHDLNLMRPNQTLDGLTAALIVELGRVMDVEKPDRVIVQGDTATAMSGPLPPITARSRWTMSRRGCDPATSTTPGPRR